jgi:hypothetical protein
MIGSGRAPAWAFSAYRLQPMTLILGRLLELRPDGGIRIR